MEACLCLGAGLLRPSRSALGGNRPCWKLDPFCLAARAGDLAELSLPARLRQLLVRTAEVWDGADGDGLLPVLKEPRRWAHLIYIQPILDRSSHVPTSSFFASPFKI